LFGGEILVVTVVFQGSNESECARDIIVADDQGDVALFVDVIIDLAELLKDSFVRPLFERAPQINADDFAKDTGIYALDIITGDGQTIFCFRDNRRITIRLLTSVPDYRARSHRFGFR
jgi:hypothetical protein